MVNYCTTFIEHEIETCESAIVGYAIRLAAAGISPYLNHLLNRVSAWARRKPGRSWQRFARAVAPENPRSVAIVFFAAIVFTGLVAIANLAIRAGSADAIEHGHLDLHADARDAERARRRDHDRHHHAGRYNGDGGPCHHDHRLAHLAQGHRAAYAAAFAIVAAKLFEIAVKFGIQRARPLELAYSGVELFSFPSGHATMAAVIFGILAVLVSHSMGRWSKAVVYATCAIVVVSIGYSRVYLGAHWLSDVLAGLLFGTVMMAAFGVAIEAIPPRRIKPLGLFGAAFIVFIAAGAVHVSTGFTRAEEVYARPQNQISFRWPTGWPGTGRNFPPVASISPASRRRSSSRNTQVSWTGCRQAFKPRDGP